VVGARNYLAQPPYTLADVMELMLHPLSTMMPCISRSIASEKF
jgi:hypothetical protein